VDQANDEVSSSPESGINAYEGGGKTARMQPFAGMRSFRPRRDSDRLLTDMLHVQSNPLPICTRPRVLIKGKRT
jgi:hypothetical protein